MASPELPVVEINVCAADASMDAVAERVVALLAEGTIRIVDFAGATGDQTIIRAVCYRGDDDAR